MAIRVRDKKSTDAGVSMKDGASGRRPTKETNSDEPIPDVRSFREQAIMVINILESQGIDLYDPARTPGMYLKRRGTSKVPDNLVNKILIGDSDRQPTRKTPPASVERHSIIETGSKPGGEIPPGLFSFLTGKK
jgi:hypothetical protein